jgi:hypothetical protein
MLGQEESNHKKYLGVTAYWIVQWQLKDGLLALDEGRRVPIFLRIFGQIHVSGTGWNGEGHNRIGTSQVPPQHVASPVDRRLPSVSRRPRLTTVLK